MKSNVKRLTFILFVVLVTLQIIISSCASVPVAPNEAVVEGEVSEYSIVSSRLVGIKPEQTLYRIKIRLFKTKGTGFAYNRLKDKIGRDIPFYSKRPLSPELFGRMVRVRVSYRGDERGGKFWIKNITLNNSGG